MYFVGIDGGGTTTNFYLTDGEGRLIESLTEGCSNYLVGGLDHTIEIYRRGIEKLCKNNGIDLSNISSCFFAMAGFGDIASDVPEIKRKVKAVYPNLKISIGNDTYNALAGSLAGEDGINIIAGTGSIGLGKKSNEYMRSGGWHHIFGGDEGSAYWIASNLLRHFTRQSDNREERTYLYTYLKDKYSWTDDSMMLTTILDDYKEDRSKIASFSKDVSYCAEKGDKMAKKILKDAAKELSEIILAIYKEMHFEHNVLVSYSGGVFKSGPYILDPLKEYLSDYDIKFVKPILSPGAGSVLLAMEAVGIVPNIDKLKDIE